MSSSAPTGKDLADFIAFANRVANGKRDDAGYAGSWGDGGARSLEENIKTWHAGLQGKIPESLENMWTDFQRQKDPEYANYLALKKKFE